MFKPPRPQVTFTLFLKDPGKIQYSFTNTNVLPDSVCSRALWALMSLIMRCCSSSFVLISLSWSSRERHIFSRFACLHEEQKKRWLVVQLIISENLKSYEGKKEWLRSQNFSVNWNIFLWTLCPQFQHLYIQCPLQGGWNEMISKVPSNQINSIIL